jgi:hypothetical protein
MRPDFKEKLESFFAGCQRIRAEYHAANNSENKARWKLTWPKRYVRIESPAAHVGCDLVPSPVTARFDTNSLQSLNCDGVTP